MTSPVLTRTPTQTVQAFLDAFARHGQAVDMVTGAVSNLRNIVLHLPGPTLPGLSPSNRYASNTINVWINSAAYQGIPRIALASAAIILIAAGVYAANALRRIHLASPTGPVAIRDDGIMEDARAS